MHINTPHFGSGRFHTTDFEPRNRQVSSEQASLLNASNNQAPTTLAPVDAVATVAKPTFDDAAVSKSILSFVQQRLSKAAEQGASKEQLGNLLAQARDGVAAGFDQAIKQLNDTGALNDVLSSGISAALQKVDSGLDNLAKEFGLSSNADTAANTVSSVAPNTTSNTTQSAPSNTATNTVATSQADSLGQLAASYQASFSSNQSVDLIVQTADGDTVHLQLGVRDKQSISASYQANADGQQLTISTREKSSARLNISVDGNLDAGELKALSDLLDKVGSLADSFFSGDVGSALQQAGSLDFSNPELSSLSLNLHSEVRSKAQVAAYQQVQSLDDNASSKTTAAPALSGPSTVGLSTVGLSTVELGDLANALTSLVPKATLANNSASLLKQLLAAQLGATNQQNNPLLHFANRLLSALGADAAPSVSTPVASNAAVDSSV